MLKQKAPAGATAKATSPEKKAHPRVYALLHVRATLTWRMNNAIFERETASRVGDPDACRTLSREIATLTGKIAGVNRVLDRLHNGQDVTICSRCGGTGRRISSDGAGGMEYDDCTSCDTYQRALALVEMEAVA